MFDFNFSVPTDIHFGKECEMKAGSLMAPLAKKVMMIYGSDRIFRTGLGDRLKQSLQEAGCTVICRGGVKPNAEIGWIEETRAEIRREKVEGILAVGGGSVIDSAKALAATGGYEGSVLSFYENPQIQPDRCLPIGAVVTIPATASESNVMSVVSDTASGRKIAKPIPKARPRFALLNPELTLTLPAYQTACGSFDIFAHAFERYFDLRRGSQLLDAMTEAVMKQVVEILPQVLAAAGEENREQTVRLRGELMLAATIAHNDMLGPGGDFACHEISHVITEHFGLPHGAALAMIIPAWCRSMWKKEPDRFSRFFSAVFGAEGSCPQEIIEDGIIRMERYIEDIGLKLYCRFPEDCSGEKAEQLLEELAAEAAGPMGKLGGGLAVLEPEEIREICRLFIKPNAACL